MGIIGHLERNNKFIQHYSATVLSEVECCFYSCRNHLRKYWKFPDLENQIGEEHLKDFGDVGTKDDEFGISKCPWKDSRCFIVDYRSVQLFTDP